MTEKQKKILEIINEIRADNGLSEVNDIFGKSLELRKDLEFESIDLAILTARLEDVYEIDIFEKGILQTVDEVLQRLG